ncbi:unnamed protein product [Mytilus edulis]|uniref:Uncharacterized protein n=1 Tax=Mytilus edulis TaxID=6550 RepID=A0A8S3RP02_MYTED|nr:unnamed protein product [Mytilus edulis]
MVDKRSSQVQSKDPMHQNTFRHENGKHENSSHSTKSSQSVNVSIVNDKEGKSEEDTKVLHTSHKTHSSVLLAAAPIWSDSTERDINMDKVCVNFCGYDELLLIPSVGQITADRIWELRKQGDITPEMLVTIPHIRMDVVHQFIDYTTLCDVKFVDHVEDDLEDFVPSFRGRSKMNMVKRRRQKFLICRQLLKKVSP